jgi:hypothetical protein
MTEFNDECLDFAEVLEGQRLHRELQDPTWGEPTPLFRAAKNAGVDGEEVSAPRKPAASERPQSANRERRR